MESETAVQKVRELRQKLNRRLVEEFGLSEAIEQNGSAQYTMEEANEYFENQQAISNLRSSYRDATPKQLEPQPFDVCPKCGGYRYIHPCGQIGGLCVR